MDLGLPAKDPNPIPMNDKVIDNKTKLPLF